MERLIVWARRLKCDVLALWIAARDARTPRGAKVTAGLIAAYALSPIDLIPDVIPVLGLLDDLLIVPLGIALVIRLIPGQLMEEFRELASQREGLPRSVKAAVSIVMLWVLTVGLCAMWLF